MGNDWRNSKLSEYVTLISGGTPSKSNPDYWHGTTPWISAKDMKSFRIEDSIDHLSELGVQAATRIIPPETVIILVRGMTLHNDIPICKTSLASAFNQDVKAVIPREGLLASYLAYLLLANKPYLLSIVDSAGHGTGRLNTDTLLETPFLLPPLPTQKAIAHILGTLDDKIELLRQMNETLEAMARALFKSWFVDFDPVRKKAEGLATGLTPEIDALFPDSFEDSELGEIPKGWQVRRLKDVLDQRREHCAASPLTENMPYLPIDCIISNYLALDEVKSGQEAQSSLIRFYKDDIIFGAMRPYFHKVCIAPFDGTTRTTAFVLKPKQEIEYSFCLMLLSQDSTIDYATSHSTGSTIPYAVWPNSMEDMPIIYSSREILRSFQNHVKPILETIRESYFQNATLKQCRDSLLPKLISGDLEVKDIDKILEPAT